MAGLVLVAPAVPTNALEGNAWSRGGSNLGSKLRLGLTRAILQARARTLCVAASQSWLRHMLTGCASEALELWGSGFPAGACDACSAARAWMRIKHGKSLIVR